MEEVRVGSEGDSEVGSQRGDGDVRGKVDDWDKLCYAETGLNDNDRSASDVDIPYLPSGWTLTNTFFFPMTFTTSPT